MTDISTYIIYILLLLFVVFGTYYIGPKKSVPVIVERKRLNILYFLILLVISFVVGFRYEVGVDWAGYVDIFKQITTASNVSKSNQYYEWGYFWINRLTGNLGLDYEWMFFIMAFISWYFYFKSVPRVLIPLFVYYLFVNEFFFWGMNGVRQFAAIAVWIFSLRYLIDKDLMRYLIFIFFASLFHASALFLLPLYFLPYDKLYDQRMWMLIFISSLIFVIFIDFSVLHTYIGWATLYLSKYTDVAARYSRYIQSGELVERHTQLGLGFIFKLVVNGFIIWASADLVRYMPKLKAYFFLFFVGAIVFNLFYDFQLIGRVNNYFIITNPILLSYISYYYWFVKKRRIIVLAVVVLYFFIFLSAIYNSSNMCCPYQISL